MAEKIVEQIGAAPNSGALLRRLAMQALSQLDGYDWCGVYRLEGDVLLLDEYVGEPTDHTAIPVGRGVCGTAVAENRNQLVDDVGSLANYLSCSLKTKSEIVVLVHDAEGGVLGQIDVDGHAPGAFGSEDEAFLERLAAILASKW